MSFGQAHLRPRFFASPPALSSLSGAKDLDGDSLENDTGGVFLLFLTE